MKDQYQNQCPHCRAEISAKELVQCRFVEELVEHLNQVTSKSALNIEITCQIHSLELIYYCLGDMSNCELAICSDCALIDLQHENHKIERFDVVYEQSKYLLMSKCDLLKKRICDINIGLQRVDTELNCIHQKKEYKELNCKNYVLNYLENLNTDTINETTLLNEKKLFYLQEVSSLGNAIKSIDDYIIGASKQTLVKESSNFLHVIENKFIIDSEHLNAAAVEETATKDFLNFDDDFSPNYQNFHIEISDFSKKYFRKDIFSKTLTTSSGLNFSVNLNFGSSQIDSDFLTVFVELVKDFDNIDITGNYQFKIEMIGKDQNIKKEFESVNEGEKCYGHVNFYPLEHIENFVDKEKDTFNLNFSVRAFTWRQQARDLENLIKKEQIKFINYFKSENLSNKSFKICEGESAISCTCKRNSVNETSIDEREDINSVDNDIRNITSVDKNMQGRPTSRDKDVLKNISSRKEALVEVLQHPSNLVETDAVDVSNLSDDHSQMNSKFSRINEELIAKLINMKLSKFENFQETMLHKVNASNSNFPLSKILEIIYNLHKFKNETGFFNLLLLKILELVEGFDTMEEHRRNKNINFNFCNKDFFGERIAIATETNNKVTDIIADLGRDSPFEGHDEELTTLKQEKIKQCISKNIENYSFDELEDGEESLDEEDVENNLNEKSITSKLNYLQMFSNDTAPSPSSTCSTNSDSWETEKSLSFSKNLSSERSLGEIFFDDMEGDQKNDSLGSSRKIYKKELYSAEPEYFSDFISDIIDNINNGEVDANISHFDSFFNYIDSSSSSIISPHLAEEGGILMVPNEEITPGHDILEKKETVYFNNKENFKLELDKIQTKIDGFMVQVENFSNEDSANYFYSPTDNFDGNIEILKCGGSSNELKMEARSSVDNNNSISSFFDNNEAPEGSEGTFLSDLVHAHNILKNNDMGSFLAEFEHIND
ncbi:Tripartite motif containing 37 [Clydaea vesicula]|uniref:Tripartite motif containing 37 n=1 Tax=Clydaea vesicula TaxID=447962 RepID=A0AAD5Y2W3_9FUNG|nr:Tripartite motif containing 37 [Clydaea vesicula]